MEFSETSRQSEIDVTSGVNDNFKAKLEKLMQDKNKIRDRLQLQVPIPPPRANEVQNPLEHLQPPVPAPRTNEIQNLLENLQLPIPLSRSNEIQNPLQYVSHPSSVSRCAISHPPPPLIFLPPPPPRSNEMQKPLDNIPSYNANGNNLRSPILSPIPPPIPPPRTNDIRKPTQNVSPHESEGSPPVTIPPLLPPPRSSQQQSRSKKLQRRISGQSFRKRFPFLFVQKANEEEGNDSHEWTASFPNPNNPDFLGAVNINEGNKEVKKERFNEADVDAYLLLEPAMAALDIGLPVDEVKRAIKEKLERTGTGFQSRDDLIENVLISKEEGGYHQGTDHVPPRQVSEIEIQVCLRSEPAKAALNMDLSLRRVKQAIKDKLERTGCGFSSGDELIEAALNIPEKDELLLESTLLTEKNKRRSDEERLCKICMEAEICIVFVQCGHLITCMDCSKNLKKCPICRCPIESTVKTFLP